MLKAHGHISDCTVPAQAAPLRYPAALPVSRDVVGGVISALAEKAVERTLVMLIAAAL